MKRIKEVASLMMLVGVIMLGITDARAGLIMSDFTAGTGEENEELCVDNTEQDDQKDGLLNMFKDIFGKDVTDIIFGDEGRVDCGVIIRG